MSETKKKDAVEKKEKAELDKQKESVSQRFIGAVTNEIEAAVGKGVQFDENQRRLATNLFVCIDGALKQADADRVKNNKKGPEMTWKNVNMQKLALDSVHRIQIGLDALAPNHIHVVPYLNGKTGKYDLDLRIGYRGKHFYRTKFCTDDVVDIRYELVHDGDTFKPIFRDANNDVETYIFEPADNPFERGKVIGGFGYIIYSNPKKNKLILVPSSDFEKIKKARMSGPVWKGDWEEKMQYKTVVHRTTDELNIDTDKTNMSFHYVEKQDSVFEDDLDPSKALDQPESSDRQDLDFDDTEPVQEGDNNPTDTGEGQGEFSVEADIKDEGHPFK